MINWVIHFICLNMHGVHSARSNHSKAAERLFSVKSPSDVKTPSLNLGFYHACAVPDSYLSGRRKKKSSHTKPRLRRVLLITGEVAASFCEATRFLSTPKGRMVSGTRLVTGTVFKRVRETRDRALTVKSIKQRAGIRWFTLGHNEQSMICAEDFSPFSCPV